MTSRVYAVKALIKISEQKGDFEQTLNFYQEKSEYFSEIYNIVSGVTKLKLKLDYFIEKLSDRKKISPPLKNILRAGIFELEYTSNPDYAVINSYVEIAKSYDKNSSGFVNAVLRSYLRKKSEIELPDKKEFPEKYLSIKYSHPEWLISKWIKDFGEENTEKICEFNNTIPEISLRVNTLKTSRTELEKLFSDSGLNFESGKFSKKTIVIKSKGNIKNISGYKDGLWSVQGEASSLVAEVLNPDKSHEILDVCASPGGKTTHIAELTNNCGKIFAVDLSEKKISRINENCERLGISCVQTFVCDAKTIEKDKFFAAMTFDRILVDVPCSNTGMFYKNPDARWNRTQQDIEKLTKIQYEILTSASKLLKKEGTLVYSTCSIEKEENIMQIEKFLQNNKNFQLESFPEALEFLDKKCGYAQILQSSHNTEGFFIAKLKKN